MPGDMSSGWGEEGGPKKEEGRIVGGYFSSDFREGGLLYWKTCRGMLKEIVTNRKDQKCLVSSTTDGCSWAGGGTGFDEKFSEGLRETE